MILWRAFITDAFLLNFVVRMSARDAGSSSSATIDGQQHMGGHNVVQSVMEKNPLSKSLVSVRLS